MFSDSRHNSYWKSFISPSPPLSPAELSHSFQGLAGKFLVLGLLVILLWGIFVSCCPSERHGFCFLGKLLLFPGQQHVPASGLWLIHGWTWRLWTPSFLHPCSYTHSLFCICSQMYGFWALKRLSGSHMHASLRPCFVTC